MVIYREQIEVFDHLQATVHMFVYLNLKDMKRSAVIKSLNSSVTR